MRRCTLLLFILLHVQAGPALARQSGPSARSDLAGAWSGSLVGVTGAVPVVLRVASGPGGYAAQVDVPTHGVFDQDAHVHAGGGNVHVEIHGMQARFSGSLAGETIDGTWAQGSARVPLYLRRTSGDPLRRRPQDPVGPLPYRSHEVAFRAPGGPRLAGTLTLPSTAGPHPAAVLIAGSGPHDRDGTFAGHRPLAVLADHLARHDIAVLRFDERGVGDSAGDFRDATTTDHADDVAAAVAFLAGHLAIDPAAIGLIGHSEGGMIAPMVAAQRPDVAFAVLLAAPGVAIRQIALRQAADIARAEGMGEAWIRRHVQTLDQVFDVLAQPLDADAFAASARPLLQRAHAGSGLSADIVARRVEAALDTYLLPWTRFALAYDAGPALAAMQMPVLALHGTLDMQLCATTNLDAIAAAAEAAGNASVTVREMPGLNHYFQTARTGAVSEYGVLEETFAGTALDEIARWIGLQTGARRQAYR